MNIAARVVPIPAGPWSIPIACARACIPIRRSSRRDEWDLRADLGLGRPCQRDRRAGDFKMAMVGLQPVIVVREPQGGRARARQSLPAIARQPSCEVANGKTKQLRLSVSRLELCARRHAARRAL